VLPFVFIIKEMDPDTHGYSLFVRGVNNHTACGGAYGYQLPPAPNLLRLCSQVSSGVLMPASAAPAARGGGAPVESSGVPPAIAPARRRSLAGLKSGNPDQGSDYGRDSWTKGPGPPVAQRWLHRCIYATLSSRAALHAYGVGYYTAATPQLGGLPRA
jgi:hypothetical protein